MKKLIIFIGGLNFGGMERVAFIAADLLKDEYDTTIATLYQTNANYDYVTNMYDINVPPQKGRANKIKVAVKRLLGTKKMKRELKPDIVLSFGMYSNYMNALTKGNEKIIMGIRAYDWFTRPFTTGALDKRIVSKFNSVNGVSRLISSDACKYWGKQCKGISTIYNPYDVDLIQKKANESVDDYIFEKNKIYIMSMGRLANQKAFYHLIKAFSITIKKINNLKLLIMGEGEDKWKIQNLIADLKLENDIELIGGKKNPYKYLKHANLYVLSSLAEGFPNALVEAMAVGLPVVSADCMSGPREILAPSTDIHSVCKGVSFEEYGVLVSRMTDSSNYSPHQLEDCDFALAQGMLDMFNSPNAMAEYSHKGIEYVHNFGYETFQNKLIKEIENA